MTESGIAGSAVVEHPDNPMITMVLQRTVHLRPDNSILPATPAVTIPTKKQDKEDGARVFKSRNTSITAKAAMEETLKELDHREGILDAQINSGLPLTPAEVHDEIMTIVNTRGHLKEKARLEDAGGKIADRLAQRAKKRAEEDEMNPDLLPL